MRDSLYAFLQSLTPIPEEEWRAFETLSERKAIAKNDYFVREGELADSIGFCAAGLFRFYYTTASGDEYNKSFCTKNDFIASYSSLLLTAPSSFSIQAMIDSELIVIRYKHLQSLYTRHACWERLGRLLIELLYVKKEARERELLLLSAEARYRLFLDKFGSFETCIPQYHIASYLGITPVALSRIRKKINLG